ncbi:uncharacterized protein DNG_03931 [Cephalotrichum gorgonifer]|uniref:Uncharacterized protein n=1 Tax=Cephalotrichum gorgonifer TaxID=2041049 RepID=A0AAE8SUF6_9PEZI|nr:uncharacterized protein DNG_03931 [Cephalotrichum gorgonifer]
MSGNNPLHGRDEGPRPPVGQPYYPPAQLYYYTAGYYYPTWPITYLPYAIIPPAPVYATNTNTNQPPAGNGGGHHPVRAPQPSPPSDGSLPATQLPNTTGGTGCEPGYNYFFHSKNTKMHVFKTPTPPWQLPASAHVPFSAVHVPTSTTLAELLRGFGCDNRDPKKNRCYEIVQGTGGRWYKGMSFAGDEKDAGKKTIGEIGWDETRTGQPGGKPVVCVYLTKD